jgi:hypothetical protein
LGFANLIPHIQMHSELSMLDKHLQKAALSCT